MANVHTSIVQYLHSWEKDPRVENYPLMKSIWPTLITVVLYFLFVMFAPRWMENRKPMNLKKLLLVYNLAMVLLSGYTCLEFGWSGWFTDYSLSCQPVDYSSSPSAIRMLNICWLFYFTKNIELLDTVFFILRKKNSQVTVLHVVHHGIMPISWWLGVKYVGGGFGTFHGLLNSFIHFLMYTYYGLAALGPKYQKYLWWKKYMTKAQMIQFILVSIHCSQLLFIECDYPMTFMYIIFAHAAFFLAMFANFYVKAYLVKDKPQNTQQNGNLEKNMKNKSN